MSLHGFQELICECGNKYFQAAHTLTWHQDKGTAFTQEGWVCTGCNKRSDTAKMIQHAKRKLIDIQIQELEGQRL